MATGLAALATVLLICQLWRRTESKYIATEACSVRLLMQETSIVASCMCMQLLAQGASMCVCMMISLSHIDIHPSCIFTSMLAQNTQRCVYSYSATLVKVMGGTQSQLVASSIVRAGCESGKGFVPSICVGPVKRK